MKLLIRSLTKLMENYHPTAAVIIIGNEILSGRTVDENIPYLAKKLNDLGIKLEYVHIIGDLEKLIIQTVRACFQNYTYVFTTGGIGPTHDDITTASVAKAFDCPLELHPQAVKLLQEYYGLEKLNDSSLRMALMPKGANLIPNPVTLAPGFYMKNVFVMAGVPEVMRAMFDGMADLIKPGPKIYTETVHSLVDESLLAEKLAVIQSHYPAVSIGSYPYFKNRKFGVSLVLKGIDESAVFKAKAEVVALINNMV